MTYDHEAFKRVRNKFQKFDGQSIILNAIEKLRTITDPLPVHEWNGWLPWQLMLIIRWTHQYGESVTNLPKFTEAHLRDFHNHIQGLKTDIHFDGIQEGEIVGEFIRRTIWYQLPYQMRTYELGASIGRQLILFNDLGARYNLSEQFQAETGLTIEEFLQAYYCTWALFEQQPNARWVNYRNNHLLPTEQWERFFSYLGKDFSQSRDFIRSHLTGRIVERQGIEYQLHEHTPFERFPIFVMDGRPYIYSKDLLISGLANNIFDIFKERYNPVFSRDHLGPIFQDYIQIGLDYLGCNYIGEAAIQERLPRNSKNADFLITETDAAILIEAKAVELHEVARIYQNRESVLRDVDNNSIFKALLQIIVTAHHLRLNGTISQVSKIYAVVITYREFLIGNGQNFWDNMIGAGMAAKLAEIQITNVIEPQNIYYMPIADYEFLIAGARETNRSVSSILDEISARNMAPETAGLMIRQHLEKMWGRFYPPQYLTERRNRFEDELEERQRAIELPT